MKERKWRREWDSNPRHIAVSLVFKTSSLNRSDISPNAGLQSRESSYHIQAGLSIPFAETDEYENAINKSNKGKSLVTLIFLSQSEVKKP